MTNSNNKNTCYCLALTLACTGTLYLTQSVSQKDKQFSYDC
jgi:hypothetical protein